MIDNKNNKIIIFVTVLILLIVTVMLYNKYKITNRESFNEVNNFKYYNQLLNATTKNIYPLSNKKLTLRVSNGSNNTLTNAPEDLINLPEEAVKIYNYILDKICDNRIKFSKTMSRDYYNKSIGPQLYWKVISSDDKNKDDILLSLCLIELTVFEGNTIIYKDGNIILSNNLKDVLESTTIEITQEEFQKLLINYAYNLFNEDYIFKNYLKNENLSDKQIQGVKKVISSSIQMIIEDSKNLCNRLSTYNDVLLRNSISLPQRFKNGNKFIKTYVSLREQENKNIIDFGMEKNILLNNILDKFKPFIKQENLKQIFFPMTGLDFNRLRIIPLYILKSSLTDEEKKYYSALFAMFHYSVKTNDFTNLNNFLKKQPIEINDKVKKVIRVDKNEFNYDETLNIFYNYYNLIFKELIK